MSTEEYEEHKRLIAKLAKQLAKGRPEIKVLRWEKFGDTASQIDRREYIGPHGSVDALMIKNESTGHVRWIGFSYEEIDDYKSEQQTQEAIRTRLQEAINKL